MYRKELGKSGGIFDIDYKLTEIEKLEKKSSEDSFWSNREEAQSTLRTLSEIKDTVKSFEKLNGEVTDYLDLLEIARTEEDEKSFLEIDKEIPRIESEITAVELDIMLDGEDDDKNAIMTIHPGAGGTESQDWAEMLLRMYLKWLESKNFTVNFLDRQNAEEAGIKNVTLEIKGKNVYGFTKAEIGVHRLVRISPFDSNRRRHTSFASVFVYPVIEDNISIEINTKDLRIDTFRASGAGGQHVNKTDSAIRITHFPSGIVVSCQNERSQHKNKQNALKVLKSRLYALKKQEELDKIDELAKSKTDIGWGNQIRSYTMQPYNLVKDHRTNVENGNVQSVLAGNLDQFVNAYLLSRKNNK
ncbi:peptide chain release factor 2 [candidate division KSB1 bacterium]|nr:peptide chain release factor 2 [candidate division KSB1 bacterium]